jgi:hypothetical protein
LLTAEEGRGIVNAAWEEERPARGTQDCSHLVHKIYIAAGYEYPYASSFDIYAGHESFERVKVPQPGDVIAWPGHMGIVVDPVEHSFYSLVRSGLDAQDYEAPYWRSRGRPRFYRYVVTGSASVVTTKAVPVTRRPAPMMTQSDASAIDQHEDLESSAAKKTPKSGSARTAVIYGPPAPNAQPGTATQNTAAVVEERERAESSAVRRSPKAASERAAMVYGPPTAPPTAATPKTIEIPASIVIGSRQQKPTRDEVAEGILEVNSTAANVLRSDDPLKAHLPVVIFDRLTVERLEIKRDHGWAHLIIESRASIGSAGAVAKAKREKVLWELKRTESGWEAVTPLDRHYVPGDVAVRILAEHLAQLTESEAASEHNQEVLRQEAQLASLLSTLLQKN